VASYSLDTEGSFLWLGHEDDHSLLSSVDFMNGWSCASHTYSYGMCRGNLKFGKIDYLPSIWADAWIELCGNSHKEVKHRVSYSICVMSNSLNNQSGKFSISSWELYGSVKFLLLLCYCSNISSSSSSGVSSVH